MQEFELKVEAAPEKIETVRVPEETTLYADLDFARLEAVRQQLPILSARRTDLYEVREK